MNIYHFYHVYCGPDANGANRSWQYSVDLHIDALKRFGLIKKLDTIHTGIVGPESHREEFKSYMQEKNINITVVNESDGGWEQITQSKLYDFAQGSDGYVLYAHTKGSYNFNILNNNWCKSMTYYNVVKWRDCIKYLKDYDAVGAYWFDFSDSSAPHIGQPHTGQRWFAGTYWWTKLEKIRSIGYPPSTDSRYDAEIWIGRVPNIKPYNLAPSGAAGELIEW